VQVTSAEGEKALCAVKALPTSIKERTLESKGSLAALPWLLAQPLATQLCHLCLQVKPANKQYSTVMNDYELHFNDK